MSRFGRRDTAPELALRRALHARGLRYFVDRRVSTATRCRADIVFPRARIAVFVDGCFWHHCDQHIHLPKANAELWRTKLLANRQRDAHHDAVLRSEGWKVLRVWEHEDPDAAADRVERELQRWARIARTRHRRTGGTARPGPDPPFRYSPISQPTAPGSW
ncbi:very short patch repair endonuclease [Curtobacterium sp. VKM Ac-2922]|nr:very short patch repair endonuclease [Curtobacterium sp. VKM Ac-2922]